LLGRLIPLFDRIVAADFIAALGIQIVLTHAKDNLIRALILSPASRQATVPVSKD